MTKGVLLCAGLKSDRCGIIIIGHAEGIDTAQQIIDGDPCRRAGPGSYRVAGFDAAKKGGVPCF